MINNTKKKFSENIRKTLCYAADQTRFFVYNFEIMQKKIDLKQVNIFFFYTGNFKKIKYRYLSFKKVFNIFFK
jgi:hypothetical protein